MIKEINTGKLLAVIALVAVISLFTWVSFQLVQINQQISRLNSSFHELETLNSGAVLRQPDDLAKLSVQLRDAQSILASVKQDFERISWLIPLLRYLPKYGPDVSQGKKVMGYGLSLAQAGSLTIDAVQPVALIIKKGSLEQTLPEILVKLRESSSLFKEARNKVEEARAIRAEISDGELSPETRNRLRQADDIARRLEAIDIVGLQGPALLAPAMELSGAISKLRESLGANGTIFTSSSLLGSLPAASKIEELHRLLLDPSMVKALPIVLSMLEDEAWASLDPDDYAHFLSLADEIYHAVWQLSVPGQDAIVIMNSGEETAKKLALLQETLSRDGPLFQDSLDRLKRAREHRAALNTSKLPQQLEEIVTEIDLYSPSVEAFIEIGYVAPELLGSAQEALRTAQLLSMLSEGKISGGQTLSELLSQIAKGKGALMKLEEQLAHLNAAAETAGPAFGGKAELQSVFTLVQASRELATATESLIEAFQHVGDAFGKDAQAPEVRLQLLTEALRSQRDRLLKAQSSIERARTLSQQASIMAKDEKSGAVPQYWNQIDGWLNTMDRGVSFALSAPRLFEDMRSNLQEFTALRDTFPKDGSLPAETLDLATLREQVEHLQAKLSDMESAWKQLEPLYGFMDSLGIIDGREVEETLQAGIKVTENTSKTLVELKSLLNANSPEAIPPDAGNVMEGWLARGSETRLILEGLAQRPTDQKVYVIQPRAILSEQISWAVDKLDEALVSFQALYGLLGFDKSTSVLILGQDDHELRPTGGFIGMVAEMKIGYGVPQLVRFWNSYDLDPPPPNYEGLFPAPPAFRKYMAGQEAFAVLMPIRDANWWADFPTTAMAFLRIWNDSRPSSFQPQVIVAMDTRATASLADALAPVYVPGHEGPLDSAMVLAFSGSHIPYPCKPTNSSSLANRCFSEDLLRALLERLQGSPDRTKLARLLLRLLAEKHILIYSQNPEQQKVFEASRWAGNMKGGYGDYLMAADWTAYSKAAGNITRSLSYHLDLGQGNDPIANLKITYNNHSPRSSPCRQFRDDAWSCYWNYMRLYVPFGVQMVQTPWVPLPQTSLYGEWLLASGRDPSRVDTLEVNSQRVFYGGKTYTEVGAFFVIGGGETKELEFKYRLPGSSLACSPDGTCRYSLTIQKQPGTVDDDFSVEIHLPEGGNATAVAKGGTVEEGLVAFNSPLVHDQEVWVQFTMPGTTAANIPSP